VVSSMEAGAFEVPRTKTWWPFDHPPAGTCVPDCRLYGRCHCGCGELPTRSVATVAEARRVRGRPYTFRSGHQARVLPRHGGGNWSKHGVPVGRVRPLLQWLHERHGTWDEVAELLRMPKSTIKGYANNARRRRVPPEAARRIQQLVLAHRKRRSVLDQWESEPGMRPVVVLWPPDPRRSRRL
jgi:hypothetical protein